MAQRPSEGTLVPMQEESVDWETTKNVIVEGENLEVLKVLQRSYHGRVKLIYIDPPYNTGKDFVYPDNFHDPLGEYLKASGQAGEDGGRLRANAETSGRYHSAWLSMMWPRLHLARSLLSDDGVMVASIDDNEAPRLRLLLDEIFGEENFVAALVWEGGRKNDATFVSVGHDYMLVYARNIDGLKASDERWRVPKPGVRELAAVARGIAAEVGDDAQEATRRWREHLQPLARRVRNLASAAATVAEAYPEIARTFPEVGHPVTELPGARYNRIDARGAFRADNLSWPGGGGPKYDVLHPVTREPVRRPTRGWLYQEPEMQRLIAEDRIDFKEDESGVPEFKRYLDDVEAEVMTSVFYRTRTRAQQDLNELMDADVFDFPKDVEVLVRIMEAATRDDSIVMDFFAGSGTLAEACLTLNSRDGGNRRFLLSQIPEAVESGAFESLAALCRERVRRADARISEGAESGAAGFRSYRLDVSAVSRPTTQEEELVFEVGASIPIDRGDEGLLAEVLLARGFDLTTDAEWVEVEGVQAANVEHYALLACFARALTPEQFEALVGRKPAQLILLEEAFGANDEVKINALQHLKTVNAHRETAIELLLL